jgi:membrane fusion protein (multidrug efflux system)
VATGKLWVEANFKETDLTNVAVGQAAEVEVDTYPGRKWKAHVASISPASGAEFSVLPAQNATGNWVKIVQRIPVRVTIDPVDGAPTLRPGMSAEVEIDTGRANARYVRLFGGKEPEREVALGAR